ncbi:MAG: hypothetical protein ACI9HK_006040 [Pirellulaceae bacterium]|jgi:hypothetical protein
MVYHEGVRSNIGGEVRNKLTRIAKFVVAAVMCVMLALAQLAVVASRTEQKSKGVAQKSKGVASQYCGKLASLVKQSNAASVG